MTSISVSVPDALNDWLERRAEAEDYGTSSDYVLALILRDRQDSEERDAVSAALAQGEASGTSARRVPDILASLRAEGVGAR